MSSVAIRRAVASGKSISTRLLNYDKNGQAMWTDLSIVPIRSFVQGPAHLVRSVVQAFGALGFVFGKVVRFAARQWAVNLGPIESMYIYLILCNVICLPPPPSPPFFADWCNYWGLVQFCVG